MKILLDQGVPRSSASLLRNSGFDAVHTGECGMSTAKDADILEAARREDKVVVTLDSDFHTIIALSASAWPSVIRIRIEGLRAPEMARLIVQTLEACSQDIKKGALVSVDKESIRLRRLPIVREPRRV